MAEFIAFVRPIIQTLDVFLVGVIVGGVLMAWLTRQGEPE